MDKKDALFHARRRLKYDPVAGTFTRKPGFSGTKAGAMFGAPDSTGRLQGALNGTRLQVSHLVWLIETGDWPQGVVTHKNGDKTDNRFTNLTCESRKSVGDRTPQAVAARIRKAVRHWKPSKAMSPDERKRRQAQYRADNLEECRRRVREASVKRHAELNADENYRAARACRSALNRCAQAVNHGRPGRTAQALGYSLDEFRRHIEAQFQDWMTWANHGQWHIDHIKPVKAFIDDGVIDLRKINALSNLRPLPARENQRKGARYLATSDSPDS